MLDQLMSEKGNTTGLGLGSVLLVVFIILKLCGVITWSWVWVLSPLWIGIILWIIIIALVIKFGTGRTKYRINF